ncbi:MAG: monovalent cation/H+ antiporter subunit D [Natronospirillum sp.]|uniref:monovalent cation/H+ antiporter subunit D n=1 Tax=Natronospirillum sp. TaxID=2812955 RepID=UPI0025ECB2FC|nr:monovalent cation/H+ antiporter subunit D [Natronospirillum sp.]MCH8551424.1 monovalent cation/H+ antiporter subunit D [Natronospirillum sp.]
MMQHWSLFPVLLPLFTGAILIFMARADLNAQRWVSVISAVLGVPVAIVLLMQAQSGAIMAYAMGNWPAPFGIVLVIDRLSALLVTMTALLGLIALLYGIRGDDRFGRNYHALFHFLLLGVQGAFMTGDLFNMFVFFEVLLIASYALLMHGAGPERTRASFHYVILNVAGSAIFLIGIGTLYGMLGTLNLADLALRIIEIDPADAPIVRTAGLIMLMAFGLKAAMLPMYFWLPAAYSAASPSVAALFAIMTKVGLYAILRVHGLLFGDHAGVLAGSMQIWLWILSIGTLALAIIGLVAARTLKRAVSYLVVISVGTVLTTLAINDPNVLSGALYYLIHSTFVVAGLYLLADLIGAQRGTTRDYLTQAQPLVQPNTLGVLYFIGATAIIGLPPLSGFLSKVLIFRGTVTHPLAPLLWTLLLLAGLIALIALVRAGSTLFWRTNRQPPGRRKADPIKLGVTAFTLLLSPALAIFAEPVILFTESVALQQNAPWLYIQAVLSSETTSLITTGGGL